jgi:hydroxymethylpyrimidine pyrophosphatase-like HAD family hydrolase
VGRGARRATPPPPPPMPPPLPPSNPPNPATHLHPTEPAQVLPRGASKGAGVEWLLREMGHDPAHLMALGDGENDIELLELAALGVAMANAGPKLKAVADVVVASNDEDGVAEAIERHVLAPRRARGRAP